MSLTFAIPSRLRAGGRFLRWGFALAAVFLEWHVNRAQETNKTAPLPPPAPPAAVVAAASGIVTSNTSPVVTMATNTVAATTVVPAADTNDISDAALTEPDQAVEARSKLEEARHLRLMRQPTVAEPILVDLLRDGNPDAVQQSAMLELALVAQDENNLTRAEQIYAQFVSHWSNDKRIPEIFLHQGQLFRQMGVNSLALAKFYSVMTSALALKNDQLAYYEKIVLDAQNEIAETHYEMGHYAEAADFFSRLLKQDNPALNRPEIQFRLIRSLHATANYTECASQAQDFLTRYADSPNQPEVRFCLALSLKQLGRNGESLQQVLTLLQQERTQAKDHPEVWAYWQQRTGNEIANQLYGEGDYTKALDVYLSLKQLDHAPAWQLPVTYQIGMTYERLLQPEMATQTYSNIVSRETELGTNASPGLTAIVEMARWRINFIQWQSHADSVNQVLAASAPKKDPNQRQMPATAMP
jgi:tetratricopeptide (TPR) repeat protein